MKLRYARDNIGSEIGGKEGEKPKFHSRKAPLIAGLIAATALAVGACTAKETGEEPENRKGNCIYEMPVVETKTVSYAKTVREGDIACQGTNSPIASALKVVKIDERKVELAYEADIAMEADTRPIEIWYGTAVKLLNSDLAPTIKVKKGKNAGEAVINVEYSEPYREWLKRNDFVENYDAKTISYTKVIDEGDSFPLAAWTGSDNKIASADLGVMDMDEEGIEVGTGSYRMFVGKPPLETIKIHYGETLTLEKGAVTFEITPERKCVDVHVVEGLVLGTVVTVKTTISPESAFSSE